MSTLEQFSDMTGQMNPTDVNAQNISNIIDEFNRSQDLLDALNTTPKILAKGSSSFTWTGSSSDSHTIEFTIGAATDFIFLCYYSRSDVPNSLYPIYDLVADGSGNVIFIFSASSQASNLEVEFVPFSNGSAITFTVYYFIFQQPANVSTS